MKLIEAKFPYPKKAYEMLFQFKDSVICSIFENITGRLYVDNENEPTAVLACYKDFCFMSGGACEAFKAENLEEIIFSQCDNPVFIADNSLWVNYLSENTEVRKISRYKLEAPESFDRNTLEGVMEKINELVGFKLEKISGSDFDSSDSRLWEHDIRGCCKSREEFCERSFGYKITKDGRIISFANAYAYYSKGIEVQIETLPDFRSMGLASAVGAALVLECSERGLTPHWDAANLHSARLAQRLGFELLYEYDAYEMRKRINEN